MYNIIVAYVPILVKLYSHQSLIEKVGCYFDCFLTEPAIFLFVRLKQFSAYEFMLYIYT